MESGPSTLALLTASNRIFADRGEYEVRDPARQGALWRISDRELSKSGGAIACGSLVNFGRLDGSRTTYALADGKHIGSGPPPGPEQPILANPRLHRVDGHHHDPLESGTADRPDAGEHRGLGTGRRLPPGLIKVIEGYIVLSEGATMSVLRPN